MGKYNMSGAEEVTVMRLYQDVKDAGRVEDKQKAKYELYCFVKSLPAGAGSACARVIGIHPTSFWITYVKPFKKE